MNTADLAILAAIAYQARSGLKVGIVQAIFEVFTPYARVF